MRSRVLVVALSLVIGFAFVPGVGGADEHDDPVALSVYLLLDQTEVGPLLVPVHREVGATEAPATAAVNALLDGPTQAEADSLPAVSTGIPDGVSLNGIALDEGLATVDMSADFADGGGSFAMISRLAQLVYTVTQFPTIDAIALELDGEPTTVFSGEGLDVTPPVDRSWFDGTGILPPVFVDTPSYGGHFDARITGSLEVDTFDVEILDGDGRLLGSAAPSIDVDDQGPFFDVTVPYVSLVEQFGAVLVQDPDAPAASVREYPVTLAPTPVPAARGIDMACAAVTGGAADFTDVSDTNAHVAAIDCITGLAIAEGRSATTYAPARTVTRGQMATMLAGALRAVDVELPDEPASPFTDVDGTTHAMPINQLAELGIVAGLGDDTYRPNLAVSREQMASLLVGVFEYAAGFDLEAENDYFLDDDASVHESSINAAALAGLTTGLDRDHFGPSQDLRRDQMATFVARLLDLLVVEGAAVITE